MSARAAATVAACTTASIGADTGTPATPAAGTRSAVVGSNHRNLPLRTSFPGSSRLASGSVAGRRSVRATSSAICWMMAV